MKTAISIPDAVFERAEKLAKQLKKSRSQLYSEAVADYIARHDDDAITQAMDAVCDELGDEGLDPFTAAASRRVLKRSDW